MIFKALTTTTAVSDWLDTSLSPHVLHLFDKACNLVDDKGRVISLVTPQIGKGPFSIVVDLPQDSFTDYIEVNSPIHLSPDRLQIGSINIDVKDAQQWQPRPFWESVSSQTITQFLPLFKQKLAVASPDSLAHVNGRSGPMASKAKITIDQLHLGLQLKNWEVCYEAAAMLAGLGGGLTPAGDDYLLGAMYGLWIKNTSYNDTETEQLIKGIANVTIPRTTTLSGAWLAAAAKGEAGQPWHQLVNGMASHEETATSTSSVNAVSQAIDAILATGHTSGADALTGFVNVIRDS